MTHMTELFAEAFASVLRYELDRRMLVALCEAKREVRYEELRRTVNESSSEAFKRAFDRLQRHALISRRLIPQGEENYESHLSPTVRGQYIASLLVKLSHSTTDAKVPKEVAAQASAVLLGRKGAKEMPRDVAADAESPVP
jgi:DNA-binding HxlR family transcriptional regulator